MTRFIVLLILVSCLFAGTFEFKAVKNQFERVEVTGIIA